MSGEGYTVPTLGDGWDNDVQKPNIAFTLVARNDRTKEVWKNPKNSARYISGPRVRHVSSKVVGEKVEEAASVQVMDEPAIRLRFNQKPKDYAKGFLLGSNDESCDVVLGRHHTIDPEMVAFTYNKEYELIMNVLTDKHTTVTFNDQEPASRQRFSWIFPRGQNMIRVTLGKDGAHQLVFDVILPRYDQASIVDYHENCEQFFIPDFSETLIAEVFSAGSTAASFQEGVASQQASQFYLWQEPLGAGTFGEVRKVRRMPDGKVFAAKALKMPDSTDKDFAAKQLESDEAFKEVAEEAEKAFEQEVEKSKKDFKKEVEMLRLVSKPPHVSTEPTHF